MRRRIQDKQLLNMLIHIIQFIINIGYIAKVIFAFPVKKLKKAGVQLLKQQRIAKKPLILVSKKKRGRSKKTFLFNNTLPKVRLPKISWPKLKVPKRLLGIKKATSKIFRRLPRLRLPGLPGFSGYAPTLFKAKYFIFGLFFGLILLGINQAYFFVKNLPSPKSIGKVNFPLSTHILDRNGKLLYEIYREQNRTPVKLSDLPPYISQATISFEDKDFFHHNGISIFGGVRAARETIFNKNLQGGSTITQQLVKSALLSPERTFERKFKEMILAIWTERIYSKNEILEMYLNQVPYGGSSYGVEEAAKTYFGKHAKDLKLDEAALLAGLPQAPSVYSPHIDPERALRRRNEVLRKMEEQGYISKEESTKAQAVKLTVKNPKTNIRAPHFVFYVKSSLENLYGIREVEEGGLKVTTSLDLDIQEEAERILKEELNKVSNLNISNGAILVTNPQTGEVLAMVGSKDYFAAPSGAFNVTTALRQPGSSIKPIMYSLALEQNYSSASIIDDSPVVYSAPGAEPYRPVNYDNRFHGRVPLRYALANSYNIPAVKVLNTLGVENFVNHARKLGITTWDDPSRFGLSLTLGGGEVLMTDMAEAFGVFANNGNRTPVSGITKIEDFRGRELYKSRAEKTKVLNEGVAYIMSDILADNTARQQAFGAGSALEVPGHKVSVKTGTTNDKKDNWTIGYTPNYLVAVWVGNNDNTPMNPALTSGITGAAPIWNRVMAHLLSENKSQEWFNKPDNVVEKICYLGRQEYFLAGQESSACREPVYLISPAPSRRPTLVPPPLN